jgi:hypothetical protein
MGVKQRGRNNATCSESSERLFRLVLKSEAHSLAQVWLGPAALQEGRYGEWKTPANCADTGHFNANEK